MPDRSSEQGREPDSTIPAGEAETVSPDMRKLARALAQALADAEHKPSFWRRNGTPLALLVLGAGVALATWIFIYPPSPAPLENPGPGQLTITTAATVTRVDYVVTTGHVAVTVHATPPGGPRASALPAMIQIGPGWTDLNQPPLVSVIAERMIQKVRVVFAPAPVAWEKDFVARADFDMSPGDDGLATNGVTASAAIPEVIISAPRANPELDASYAIPSGSSYDWSPGPPQTAAEWTSHLTRADTPGQVMVGTDHGRVDSDNFRIFLAGAFAALAGAAVLAAVQEALSRFLG
jgi:hypothetical protein